MVVSHEQEPLNIAGAYSASHCRECGRPLSNPASRAAGMGPVCAGKHGRVSFSDDTGDVTDLPFDPETRDIIFHREGDFDLHFNISQIHKHHSPSGFEWGYGGSGPADFALNILALFTRDLPYEPIEDYVVLWDKSCVHPIVWLAHQDFKWQVVANQAREGSTIPGSFIQGWLKSWIIANRAVFEHARA